MYEPYDSVRVVNLFVLSEVISILIPGAKNLSFMK